MAENDSQNDAQGNEQKDAPSNFDPDAFADKMMERFRATFPTAGANQNAGSSSQSATSSGTSNDQVLQAVQALPEAMVNSFREAFTKPANGDQGQQGAESKKESQGDNETKEPGAKSFTERWFGS